MDTFESIEQPDMSRYKTDIDEIRSILSKISNVDLKFGNSLSQPIKNQKSDVNQLFFQLIFIVQAFRIAMLSLHHFGKISHGYLNLFNNIFSLAIITI